MEVNELGNGNGQWKGFYKWVLTILKKSSLKIDCSKIK